MTERLYYNDSKNLEFEAKILDTNQTENGFEVCLDRTAFYPTSGGQPYDTGTIDGFVVKNVWEKGDDIWHLVECLPPSKKVYGVVDWNRRLDHMQQHTGQHLLSAAFYDFFSANTIGFHIGETANTIDLDIKHLTKSQVHQIEKHTNRLIWENHPVKIFFIDSNQIGEYSFRKTPQVSGIVRVVQINEYDVSACGGTHVYATGEIGMIKITNLESYKTGIRVNFLCGKRCLHQFQQIWDIVDSISIDLSINRKDLPETVKRLKEDVKHQNRAIKKLEIDRSAIEAEKIWQEVADHKGLKRIILHYKDRPISELRLLAEQFRKFPNTIALLIGLDRDYSRLICTKSSQLTGVDSAYILNQIVTRLGGKGGGSDVIAEGGAPIKDPEKIYTIAKEILDNVGYPL